MPPEPARAWLQVSELDGSRGAQSFLVLPVVGEPLVLLAEGAPREPGKAFRGPLALLAALPQAPALLLSWRVQPVPPVRANSHVPGPTLAAVDLAAPSLRRGARLRRPGQESPERLASRREAAWPLP